MAFGFIIFWLYRLLMAGIWLFYRFGVGVVHRAFSASAKGRLTMRLQPNCYRPVIRPFLAGRIGFSCVRLCQPAIG
jgi:hypothetical protein